MSDNGDGLDGLSGDELGAALMRGQEEKSRLTKKILEDQVIEMRELLPPQSPISIRRVKHLLLLEECNGMWDVIPISKAINYLQEHPSPSSSGISAEEDLRAYEEAIPFDVGSDEWCFTILILHKPIYTIGWSIYHDYEDDPNFSLLLKDQGPKDALIENGIVCGQCLKISPKHRCSKCKIFKYCSRECQSASWGEHKKQCRKERLKPSTEYDRSTRKRWAEENGSAVLFIRHHCYPRFEDMRQYIGSIPSFYTRQVHDDLFKRVYSKVGTNTFKVYGKELGEVLFMDHGGIATLRAAESIIPTVIQNFPLTTNDQEVEIQQKMIAEVLARRLLSFSWDGIGGWMG